MSLLPDSFTYQDINTGAVRIHCAVGGDGPPLLLLHGYPQTHLIWHRVAPLLASEFTLVLADLRGYGDSDKPAPTAGEPEYTKRAMAAEVSASDETCRSGLLKSSLLERLTQRGHAQIGVTP